MDGRTPIFLGKSLDRWQRGLNDRDAKVRRSAAFALGRMGEDAQTAVPLLATRLLKDDNAGVRDMSASAIGDIVKALKGSPTLWDKAGGALVKALKEDENPHVRRSAAYALGAFGPQASGTLEQLRKALKDEAASVRQNAAWALGQMGKDAGEAVGALGECLNDKDTLVRRDAADALGSMGKAGSAGVQSLIELVKSEPDEVVKKTALHSLSHLAGPEHKPYARGLESLLDSKDSEIALGAAIVLARIGGEDTKPAVDVLRRALKNSDAQTQAMATASLATLGPIAAPAMHDLADVLTNANNSPTLRGGAALAIAHIGTAAEPVVPALAKAIRPSEPLEVRQYAAEAFGQMKYPATKEGLPAILEAIEKDTDPLVRQKCVWSLFPMKREVMEETKADKVLEKVLDEPSGAMNLVRYDAARKLAVYLGADAPDKTATVLLHMLTNTTLKVYNSTDAKVEGSGNEAASGRVNVQANTGGDARYMAAQALGAMGAKARKRPDVVEALKKAAKDGDAKLRETATKALEAIGVD
ncbi:MAG TPA: HEAT repeat domain-containing protein [Gemmataceae bacterium]|nr:HEAT repeat domain-containing protein [Gemmataceae bacterium]